VADSETRTFVYVGNTDSQDISVLSLGAAGDLATVETVRVPGPAKQGESSPLAVSPDKRFLYAGFLDAPFTVSAFAVAPMTGRLTYVGGALVADVMAYLVTDRAGRFLLGASYDGSEITVNDIGPDGTVGATRQVLETQPNAHCVLPAPSNRHGLHTSLGGDVVHQDRFDPETGQLTPNDPPTRSVRAKAGPRHLIFAPDAAHVYLLNERDGSIYVLPYDSATGLLGEETQVVSSLPDDFSGEPSAADIHMTPDGRFLYASERTSGTLAAFRREPDEGRLTRIGSYPTVMEPRSFQIDPSGRFLLTAGTESDSMLIHSIDGATGELAPLREHPLGLNPNWIEILKF
jgi:6-phosphogluconolactonase